MLAISGLELAMSAKDINGEVWEDAFLLFATATSTIAFSSTATGALVGAVTYFALIVAEKLVSERLRKHKQTRALRRAQRRPPAPRPPVALSCRRTTNLPDLVCLHVVAFLVSIACMQEKDGLPEVVDATAAERGVGGYREEAEKEGEEELAPAATRQA
jgi:hypothetical protein